ncbi:hypothetical protein UR09_03800 [Candidatus Nitromaritima sp. SCGC AAA799-A02]|nr:hypothetical protein UR09_03800 [Candidatus Nitromaritima sp. SCGC AAA799-A02]KMP12193.1 hypothetical protein UZ36_01905 [Candidatus Nitromaritima sp. SCGC AAA799-C22]
MYCRLFFTAWIFQFLFVIPCANAEPVHYVALGDSYTVGAGIDAKDSWPSQLARRLNASGIEISLTANLGQTGWTTQQVIDGKLSELKYLKPDFATLLIGVNDWIRGTSSKTFSSRIKILMGNIQSGLSHPNRLIMITIPDFSCSPRGSQWGYGKSAINGITRLNKILKSEAAARHLYVADIFSLSQEVCSQPGMFSGDGLHPSAQQYSRWVDLIYPIALDLLNDKIN